MLRRFSVTRVQSRAQAPSSLESTRVTANGFVRAEVKRLMALTCEAPMLNVKNLFAHNLIIYVVAMIVLINTKIIWNVLVL